ncbi:serine/threonine-protein kinase [Dermacoccus nishinomiyaensis]|uniref:serine/threonine-protein kinase n=1 Tax=Dermacoccus nishinomiyaensis TaxID=1274 RepID=UPI0013F4581E|nr:serine/threonine-protein kinase [Dermacoccus nishinomiyaensis]NHC33047.1 serine/threonine protein kinase [Dermacoccus nishinomiyaensis]
MLNGQDLQRPTYTCLQTIDGGAAAVCRKGTHEVLGITIVQKTISLLGIPDGVAHEPSLLQQFDHAHIVKVREAQFDPEFRTIQGVTFVCDYYEGGSISDALLAGHRFNLETTVAIAGQLLDALAYLHGQTGYVHRDVKPGNVLLDATRTRACLGDLGSAARLDNTGHADNCGGTLLYLDPAAKPSGQVTVASDLYGLGVTLSEMLTGRYPYESINDLEVASRLARGLRSLPDSAYELPPETPPPISKLIASLIHPDPAKRPKSAAEALRLLNEAAFIPWARTSGTGLVGEWEGHWPRFSDTPRRYRLTVTEVPNGKRIGQSTVTVCQRKPGGNWRRIKTLCGYVPGGNAKELAKVFRTVERNAQA